MRWPHLCHFGLRFLSALTLDKVLGIWSAGYFPWLSPSHSHGCHMLVHGRKDQEMQGAPLAEWNPEGVWCHAKCSERTLWENNVLPSGRNSTTAKMRTSSHVSRRQTIHISYCFFRHLLPSVYSSFHKPMSHVTCFWVQATSLLWVIPERAPSETRVVAGTGVLLWVLFIGRALFYNFL